MNDSDMDSLLAHNKSASAMNNLFEYFVRFHQDTVHVMALCYACLQGASQCM